MPSTLIFWWCLFTLVRLTEAVAQTPHWAPAPDSLKDFVWQQGPNDELIEVESARTKDGLIGVRARTSIHRDNAGLLGLLDDTAIAPQWIDGAKQVNVLHERANKRVVHMTLSSIWPLKGRDMVTTSYTYFNALKDTIYIDIFHNTEALPAVDGYVRMQRVRGRWYVQLQKDNTVVITYVGKGHPGASTLHWVAQKMAARSTYRTFQKLRQQLLNHPYTNDFDNASATENR